MKAFLLAAGKGTRLRPYTDRTPKCLMPIHGKPLLEIWLDLFERYGVDDVLINTHHLADQVETFLRKKRESARVNIRTVHEKTLLGSGGTVFANRSFVENEDDFIIAYADNLTNVNLAGMTEFHRHRCRAKDGILTMGLFKAPVPEECGIAELDTDQRIIGFVEKPEAPKSDLANGGIYIASTRIFDAAGFEAPGKDALIDFGYHILPKLSGRMYGYEMNAYLRDIGTRESYEKALAEWNELRWAI